MDSIRPVTGKPRFLTTRWTQVCAAKADSTDGKNALAELCDAYYEPVASFMRGELRDTDAAREMTQTFFTQMLAGGTIRQVEPQRGRFRSYLLGAVKHFLSHQREAARRLKRGGGEQAASLDATEAQMVADVSELSPDHAFDRQWALTLLGRALGQLQDECSAEGKSVMFDKLQPFLTGDAEHGNQAELAAALDLNLNSLKSQVHRLKKRFREIVKAEIAATLEDESMVAEEMGVLFTALRKN